MNYIAAELDHSRDFEPRRSTSSGSAQIALVGYCSTVNTEVRLCRG